MWRAVTERILSFHKAKSADWGAGSSNIKMQIAYIPRSEAWLGVGGGG